MNYLNLLGIALGLAMDAFAVSIAVGLAIAPAQGRQTFRLAFHFGLFQFMMPVLGWLAGQTVADYLATYDHWIAFALLSYVGGKMLFSTAESETTSRASDPTRGITLVTLSVATSIDALAVGLTMALVDSAILLSAVVIGLVAGVLTALGITFGGRLGPRFGRGAEIFGGLVLVAIGLEILISHLAG